MNTVPVPPTIYGSEHYESLDVSTLKVTNPIIEGGVVSNTFTTGVTPAGIAITPNGLYAYVANNNNYGIQGSDSVTVLDLKSGLVLTTITDDSFNQPYTITINSAGTIAYVTNSNTPNPTVVLNMTNAGLTYSAANSLVTTTSGSGTGLKISIVAVNIGTGAILTYVVDSNGIDYEIGDTVTLSSDGNNLATFEVTALFPLGTITKIDIATNTVTGTLTGFDGPSGMVIKGTTAYVNNYGAPSGLLSGNGHTITVINVDTNTIITTIEMGASPAAAPAALAITPDEAFIYVANYVDGNAGTGNVKVISTATNTVVATIPGLSGPFAIAINPNGLKAYVTNFGSNNFAPYGTTVSVINTATNTITKTINVGIQPSGIAVTPDGEYVYVTNYNTLYAGGATTPIINSFTSLTPGTGTVNIIDATTEALVAPTIVVGQSPSAIAISPGGTFSYVTNFISNTVSVISNI